MSLTATTGIKLDRILNMMITQMERTMAPILQFSHVIEGAEVPKDKVLRVPYIPLVTTASSDWDPAVGYGTGDFNVGKRDVPVNKRKFQNLDFTAQDLLGMPGDILTPAMAAKADKLAFDVVQDVCSVVTAANYGAAAITSAASAFDSDDILDLDTTLDDTPNFWPQSGRALVLKPTYIGNVKKDTAVKNAQASGSTQTLREGIIGRIGSFDVMPAPGLPANSENLVGFACLPFAVLFANAPCAPTEEVQRQLTDYRVVRSPKTGITMTYRAWGNAGLDRAYRTVEMSYGYAVGDEAQLKRVVSA